MCYIHVLAFSRDYSVYDVYTCWCFHGTAVFRPTLYTPTLLFLRDYGVYVAYTCSCFHGTTMFRPTMHRYVIFSRYYSVYVPYTCLWVFSGSTYNCLFQKTRSLRYRQMFVLSGVYVQLFVSGDSVFTDKYVCCQGSTSTVCFRRLGVY